MANQVTVAESQARIRGRKWGGKAWDGIRPLASGSRGAQPGDGLQLPPLKRSFPAAAQPEGKEGHLLWLLESVARAARAEWGSVGGRGYPGREDF